MEGSGGAKVWIQGRNPRRPGRKSKPPDLPLGITSRELGREPQILLLDPIAYVLL